MCCQSPLVVITCQTQVRSGNGGVDDCADVVTQLRNTILEYNSRMPDKTWILQGRTETTLVALCQAAPTVISMLEDHYSAVRHTDGALTLELLGYCNWSVVSRIPCGRIFAPMVWKIIMCVSPEAIEEFAWNLARWLAL